MEGDRASRSAPPEVIIPWRAGCPHRQRALDWVLDRWQTEYPDWPVTLAEAPDGEWCKADAVMPVIESSTADIVIIADADVYVPDVAVAVAQVVDNGGWAIPHHTVHRLTQDATDAVLHGADPTDLRTLETPYRGVAGGGMVVLPREVAIDVPLDPRFRGWGGEDHAYGYCLWGLVGTPWRGSGPLWHLWHPAQPRDSRRVGSDQSERLRLRYRDAQLESDFRALVDEAKAVRHGQSEGRHQVQQQGVP